MPFKKRRKSNNRNTKEKKAIATRLMVISLKVDDYIYKSIPISLEVAQQYMEEIATYKSKCVNDVRSLQVIEKLTLFMKSIINENAVHHDSTANCTTDSAIKDAVSENTKDKKMLTNDVVTNANKDCIIDEINIIGLTISENDEQNESRIDKANNTMKAISNVSLNNSVNNLNGDTNDIQSPSLINEINRHGFELNFDTSILTEQNNNSYLTLTENYIQDFRTTNFIDKNTNQTDRHSNQNIHKYFNFDDKNIGNTQKFIISDVKTCKFLKNDNETKDYEKKDKIEVNAKNSKHKPKEKTVRIKKAIKTPNKEEKQNTNKVSKKKGEVTKRTRKTTKNKKNTLNIFDPHNSSVKNKTLLKLDKEIARKKDLSWIENIKYVREVCKEEYDSSKTLEETFWNDGSLPVNFNFNDFDYID